MSKNQKIKIEIPIYEVEILCLISDDKEWAKRKAISYVPDEEYEEICDFFSGEHSDGFNVSNRDNGCQIIWLEENPKKNSYWLSILVHETLHATIGILRSKKIELDENSEEAFTYLQGFIFKSIYDQLK